MNWIAHIVRNALEHWGYLALACGLLGENAGLPLPGETVLMFASFIAHKSNHLALWAVILVGIAAAVLGDNLGYLVGRRLGPRLLKWFRNKLNMSDEVDVATDQIRRHGAATVFWARYIFGLRTIAGPVAGALGMEWRRFFIYNVMGACTWVTAITLTGYLFANGFHSLLGYFEKGSWAISAGIFGLGYFLWRRKKKEFLDRRKNAA